MKKEILGCMVFGGVIGFTSLSFGMYHIREYSPEFRDVGCAICHINGIGPVAKKPCLDCHNKTGGDYSDYEAPEVKTHSSANLGSDTYGEWSYECVDCHHPHRLNGFDRSLGIPAEYVLADFVGHQAVTENSKTTLVLKEVNAYDPDWADPATWAAKTGPDRGLTFLFLLHGQYKTFTVDSATDTTITFDDAFTYFGPRMTVYGQLIYGQLIDDEINGNPVVFTGPKNMAYNEENAQIDSTPDGICQVCHTQTKYWRSDGTRANHHNGEKCNKCHDHSNGFSGLGNPEEYHHATPGSGSVMIHEDTDHDDAGHNGPKPYFDVAVDCVTCHTTYLPATHGNDCSTCHPSPYDTFEAWNGGCQQGGCHVTYHEDSTMAHWPWENAFDEVNVDCDLCHNPGINAVVQGNCLNCHATYGPGDTTPPTTSLKDEINEPIGPDPVEFVGTSQVRFSMQDNGGKVGIGRTFYQIDGAQTTGAMDLMVSNDNPGVHVLNYWSIDQSGNEESPKSQTYTMIQDLTPPTTTTSNVLSEYWPTTGRTITFSASDGDSTMGVKNTYFRYNGGPVQTGTQFAVPLPTGAYPNNILEFWSDDWSGNTEEPKSVTFATTGGTVTLKLVWWDCDINPNHCPVSGEWADWYVWRGGWGYSVSSTVAHGSGQASAGWDGIEEITLPVSPDAYFIRTDYGWYEDGDFMDDQSDFPNILLKTPGQIKVINY
jgi:hypothetical protein